MKIPKYGKATCTLLLGGVILEHRQCLVDFASHSLLVLEEVEELSVVHLEQHASDLAG